ncbi:MAG: hypothetical protein GC129_05425 [Proteobacteria bacterium]|nr:hypothetical protein [Pseudomonadota bacterium]
MSSPFTYDPEAILHEASCFARARLAAVLEHNPDSDLSHIRLVVPTRSNIGDVLKAMASLGETRLGNKDGQPIGWCKLQTPVEIRPGHQLAYLEFIAAKPGYPYPHLAHFANRIVATVTENKREQRGVFLPKGSPVDWVIQHGYAGRFFNEAELF